MPGGSGRFNGYHWPMNFVRLLPVMISALLLAAHFYRAGQDVLVAIALLLPWMLLLKRTWVPLVLTVALIFGAFEWAHTLLRIAMIRAEMGAPWLRMALILGGVTLFTAASALVFRLPVLRRFYSGDSAPG